MISYINKPGNEYFTHSGTSLADGPSDLASECVQSLHGFTVTAFAVEEFLTYNSLHYVLHNLMQSLNVRDYSNLADIAGTARSLLLGGRFPPVLSMAITKAYKALGINEKVLVSSHTIAAPGSDRLDMDRVYQDENVRIVCGEDNVLNAVRTCLADLYAERAVRYRQDNGVMHDTAAMTVTVQKIKRLPSPAPLAADGLLN